MALPRIYLGDPPGRTFDPARPRNRFAVVFPNAWLFGVDLPVAELQGLLNTGPPFVGQLAACGNFKIGPFGGVGFLSGIPMYLLDCGGGAAQFRPFFTADRAIPRFSRVAAFTFRRPRISSSLATQFPSGRNP